MDKNNAFYIFARIILTPLFKCLYFYKVNNKNSLPDEGSYIICANHMEYKDPILVALAQKRQIYFMAKSDLFRFKFFNKIITALGAFPVRRGGGGEESLNRADKLLSNGKVVGIFVEGTRSKTGEFLRPRTGAALLAFRKNVPILPVCISSKGGKRPRLFHKVIISAGDILTVEDLGIKKGEGKELRNASRIVMEKIKELRKRDLGETIEND